ncbi:hypothetical protein PS15m_003000 [Mucor circinelloides]
MFYWESDLPKYVSSGKSKFVLPTRDKEAFWRTFNQSEMNGESYYYQQIVTKRSIFGRTFEKDRGAYPTWKDYYEHLISIPAEEGGIMPPAGRFNIRNISDINRGDKITKDYA